MSALPPWPGALSCKLAVPGGDSCTLLEGTQGSLYFKQELQGHSERGCGIPVAKLPSQHPASKEPRPITPSQHDHLVPCPERAGGGPSLQNAPEVLARTGLQDTLVSGIQCLVLFPKVEKKPPVIGQETKDRVSSHSFQGGIAQPLSLRLQALSLASTQILFLQGTDSSHPPLGQDPLGLQNILPLEAGVTAPTAVLASEPSTPTFQTRGVGAGQRERERQPISNTVPATPGHSPSWPQKSINHSKGGGG